jgi:hypothetical protein
MIRAVQEITIRKVTTDKNILYIIPERIQPKEWRLEDFNTFIRCDPSSLFSPGLVKWMPLKPGVRLTPTAAEESLFERLQ